MILKKPFPKMLATITIAAVMRAVGRPFEASPIATGVRLSPMIMTTGPTTTGGRTLAIHLRPTMAMIANTITYTRPAPIMPVKAPVAP